MLYLSFYHILDLYVTVISMTVLWLMTDLRFVTKGSTEILVFQVA